MADEKSFSDKLDERLDQHQKEKGQAQRQNDSDMKQLMEKKDRFHDEALRVLTTIVYPKMQELSRRFDNAKLLDIGNSIGLHCLCNFTHTAIFPATVKLDISLSPGENYGSYKVNYDLEILPMLMAYKPHDEADFPLEKSSEELVGQWVEKKILEFIDTYLQLENDLHYQSDNHVVDPVCGMSFPVQQAVCTVVSDEKTLYFCSDVCKEAFLKKQKEKSA